MTATPSTGLPAGAVVRTTPSSTDAEVDARHPDQATASTWTLLLRVVRAELIKAVSVRSTAVALGVAAFFILALGVVTTLGAVGAGGAPGEEAGPVTGPLDAPLGGIGSGLWAVVAFGVLVVTSEYSSSSIRTTLAAVPRRRVLVLGKAVAVAVTTFVVALATTAVTYAAGLVVLNAAGVEAALPAVDVVRMVLGASLYLVVVALVGSGFAWLVRSTAGAVTAVIGLLVLLPALATLLPGGMFAAVAPYLPDAGGAVYQAAPAIGPWAGFAVFAGYAVVLLVAGAAVLRRRDA